MIEIIILIATVIGLIAIIISNCIHRKGHTSDKNDCLQNSKLTHIVAGMSVNELYSQFGPPKSETIIDYSSKAAIYTEEVIGVAWNYRIEAQVIIKNGVVTKSSITSIDRIIHHHYH